MVFEPYQVFTLTDKSYSSLIKKDIKVIAAKAGFMAGRLGEVEIIISELISNAIKHAKEKGELYVKHIEKNNVQGIEIVYIDNGPGMKEAMRMLADGVSTVNTLGQGLGAIQRLSDEFDLYSQPKWGTVILSRCFVERKAWKTTSTKKSLHLGIFMASKPGEEKCGDGGAYRVSGNNYYILAADGLGHGIEAHAAAFSATSYFTGVKEKLPSELLKGIHGHIRRTRGMVGAVLSLNIYTKQMEYSGIGNISARVMHPEGGKNFISYNGIVGMNIPTTVNDVSHSFDERSILILASDGLTTRWDLQSYPHILNHDNTLIAAVLYKDHNRGNDDILVVVGRIR